MFIGHFGIGFGAKSIARRVSLGTLFMAAQFLGLLWPTLLLSGIERVEIEPGITRSNPLNFTSYPISHSLLMVCIWGLLFGLVHWFFRRNQKTAVVLGLCVLSHWLLDVVVHRPDRPLYPGDSPLVGLSLWNSVAGTLLVEGIIFGAGLVLYLRVTGSKDRWDVRPLGIGSLLGPGAFSQCIRTASPEHGRNRMGRPATVVVDHLGILDRPASFSHSVLTMSSAPRITDCESNVAYSDDRNRQNLERLTFLGDGVFAIVVALLAIDLRCRPFLSQ